MKIKNAKINVIISFLQLIILIIFFIWGINFKTESRVLDSNFFGVLSKIQISSNWQNFFWCLTNNISVLFIVFWLNYLTFGIIGTLWNLNNVFILAKIIKISLLLNSWLGVIFISLEIFSSLYSLLLSTHFRLEKYKLRKSYKEHHINEITYKNYDKHLKRNILINLSIIGGLLLIAAILETITLKYL